MIGFVIGVVTVNAFEWYAHKVFLHEYPIKHRNSPFFTHIRHHKRAKLNNFHDEGYGNSMWKDQDVYMEKAALISLCTATTLLFPIAPFFTLGTYYGAWNYWSTHAKSHLDPEYAKQHIPWHYDHHMNANQNANWCVTRPWFDYIMGTRVISDPSTAETNPLGMKLPSMIEKPLNYVARRLLKRAYAQIEQRSKLDAVQRAQGQMQDLIGT